MPTSLLLPLLMSCVYPFQRVTIDYACTEESPAATGTATFGDESIAVVGATTWMDVDGQGGCITAMELTLDLDRECYLYADVERVEGALQIVDLDLSGEEGCGLAEDGGWRVEDPGGSAIVVEGELGESDHVETWCFNGAATISLDAVLLSSTEPLELTGEIAIEGVFVAQEGTGECP